MRGILRQSSLPATHWFRLSGMATDLYANTFIQQFLSESPT